MMTPEYDPDLPDEIDHDYIVRFLDRVQNGKRNTAFCFGDRHVLKCDDKEKQLGKASIGALGDGLASSALFDASAFVPNLPVAGFDSAK